MSAPMSQRTPRHPAHSLIGVIQILSLILAQLAMPFASVSRAYAAAPTPKATYDLKWYAADPAPNKAPYLPTYVKQAPSALACPTPTGSTGRATNPLTDAVAYASPASSSNLDAVTSLAPKDMALGQIVPFELEVTVSASGTPEDITVSPYWLAKTTPGDNFGFNPAYGVYCAFVDTGDPGTSDPGANATVASFSSTTKNPGTNNEQIAGSIEIAGLDNGDKVIVEIWVVLKNTIPTGATGNVQTGLDDAQSASGTRINTGNQTVPLLQVGSFFTANADLTVTKSDSPDPVNIGGTLSYTIVATNNSADTVANGVVVYDLFDPNTTFVSASGASCTLLVGIASCNLGALNPGQSTIITITVTVKDTAPTDGTITTGSCIVGIPGVDLCNNATVTAMTDDPTTDNNSDSEPTNVNVVNHPPVAQDDSASTGEDLGVTITVLSNDSDVDGNLNPASVTVTTAPTHGTYVVNAGGTVTYTPNANYNGPDSFTYQVCDTTSLCASANVTISLNPLNDPPDAVDDQKATAEDTPVMVVVLENDSDPDLDPLTVTGVGTPSHGTAALNPDGTVTYTPSPNFYGSDSFTYSINDGHGSTNTATVSITVNPVNDPPLANDDMDSTPEDTPINVVVLANDTDPENNPLIVSSVNPADSGMVTLYDDGSITYTPDENFSGEAHFSYTISDNHGSSATATVTISVTPVNDPPLASDDWTATDEDFPLVVDVLYNDSDVDNDLLSVTAVGTPAHGTAMINPDGTLSYTPDLNYHGEDSFDYTISDGQGGSATAMVMVAVAMQNDPPAAEDDTATTNEDTPVSINVLSNDKDDDGNLDPATLSIVTPPSHGTAVVDATTHTIIYTPQGNFHDLDDFSYEVCDTGMPVLCDTATVIITVDAVNDAPDAVSDAYSTAEDTELTISAPGVLENDSDIDDDALMVSSHTQPTNGIVSVATDGGLIYTPNADFYGIDTFEYTISDGNGGTDTATVTITVDSVNDNPVALNDQYSTAEDTQLTVEVTDGLLKNDSDADHDPLTVSEYAQPANGSVIVAADGSLTYTPNADFNGLDSFTYTISDGNGGSATATVTIMVNSVNDGPDAVDDAHSTDEDTPITVVVLANDTDPDKDLLTVTSVGTPDSGTAALNPDGSVSYTPAANFVGEAHFSYTISDGNGGSDTATVTIVIDPVNDPPVANPDSASTDEDTPVIIDVVANDTDVDYDTLTVTGASDPANGTAVINSDGTVTYTPDLNYHGGDSFEYTISDGHGGTASATVTVSVATQNDPPVAEDDPATTDEDTPVSIDVLNNDSDVDGNLDLASLNIVGNGPANGAAVVDAITHKITYTPNLNYNGPDSFTYQVCDTGDPVLCDTAIVTITVNAVNDAPDAKNDEYGTAEDTPISIPAASGVLVNDDDIDHDSLTVTTYAQPANGSVNLAPDGSLTYTPDLNFNGTDTFEYTISDSHGGTDTATVTITVASVNDNPVAHDDEYSTAEDTQLIVDAVDGVLKNDSDADHDPLTVIDYGQPSNGSVIVAADGNLIYTPNHNFHGQDSFTYIISDGNGGSDTATVIITVASINDAPVAENNSYTTNEDTALNIPAPGVLANDSDPDGDILTVISNSLPAHGGVTVAANGSLIYTPDPNFYGTDQFTYTINDGHGGSATATVTITVISLNDPPVANPDSASTDEDTPVVIDVLDNDTDADEGDTLSVTNVSDPANGTAVINADGTVTYTPDLNYHGGDSFTYNISDGHGGTASTTVTVAVATQNDPPVAENDPATTNEDTPVKIDVLSNDSDVDGNLDPATLSVVTYPTRGSVEVDATTHVITYTPESNFHGLDTFTYQICDTGTPVLCDTADVLLTVEAVNDNPVAQDDAYNTPEDIQLIVNATDGVLANDDDIDDDSLTVTGHAQPVNGSVSVAADGSLVYTPKLNFHGTDSFDYTISDGHGGVASAIVTITVDSVNDAPVANPDQATTPEETPVNIVVLTNDSDIDGDTLSVIDNTKPNHGIVALNADGSFTYTPNADYNGPDSFIYTISDGSGGNASATVAIEVTPVNDPPVARPDQATTFEDTPVDIAVLENDEDVDGNLNPGSLSQVSAPANGSVSFANGKATYTPNANFNGDDSFVYQVCDSDNACAQATVTVTVNPVNDGPDAKDDTAETPEDTAVIIPVLDNDTDVDKGDSLSVTEVSDPEHGTAVVNDDGTVTYTPDPNYNGDDSFTYTACDLAGACDTATVTVKVSPANDGPDAKDDTAETPEDAAVIIPVLDNDKDIDGDGLTVTIETQPEHGTVEVNADGSVTYTPDPNYNGDDSFTYIACDPSGACDMATVSVTVSPVNDAPVAEDDSATTPEDTPVDIAVLENDKDIDGNSLTVTIETPPSHGTALVNPDGTVTYTPNANYHGGDSFTYTVCDPSNACDTATVTVGVATENDPPVAENDTATTDEDVAATIDVLSNDKDVDGNLDPTSVSITAEPINGSVTVDPITGAVTYTPKADFNGDDSFSYKVCDTGIPVFCDTADVSITVAAVNDPPVAQDDPATTNEDTAVSIPVLNNDKDIDNDLLTVTQVSDPQHGTAEINPDGTVTYTPDANYHGDDSFTYTVCDPSGACDTATVTVTVNPTNDPPVAEDDSKTTNEDTAVTIPVLANDKDIDGSSDSLHVGNYTQPGHGTLVLNPDGSFTYTPEANWNGIDSFTYEACDTSGVCDGATVTITVTPVDDAPVALDDLYSTDEDTPLTIPAPGVLDNDQNVDSDALTVGSYTAPAHGTLTQYADGSFSYVPNANWSGTDSYTYNACDTTGNCAQATVTITVKPVNDPPVAQDDAYSVNTGSTLNVLIPGVLGNDSDVDLDPLMVLSHSDPNHGVLTFNPDGSLSYTPTSNIGGSDSFTYTISDDKGGSATATVVIMIENPSLSLTKSANPTTFSAAGQVIDYTYTAMNTGNVSLDGPFSISDDKLGTFQCGTATSLAPGESVTCMQSYTIQASDLGNTPSLPNKVKAAVDYGDWLDYSQSLMNITLTGVAPNANFPNGVYAGWCVQYRVDGQMQGQQGTLYSSTGSMPADAAKLPWNKINYVLNHKIRGAGKDDTAFAKDVQTAIWLLQGEKNTEFAVSREARQMVSAANANPNYVPGAGDIVAVLVYSDGMNNSNAKSFQEVIIEVELQQPIVNHASASTSAVSSNEATASVTQVAATAQLAPTSATCSDFSSSTAPTLWQLLYSRNAKGNKVTSVAPGAMFYYSRISAPSANFSVQVTQSNPNTLPALAVQQANSRPQAFLYTANCTKSKGQGAVTITVDPQTKTQTLSFNVSGATAGTTYYVGIKYVPSPLVGMALSQPYPTSTYTFLTSINNSDIRTSQASLVVQPKP